MPLKERQTRIVTLIPEQAAGAGGGAWILRSLVGFDLTNESAPTIAADLNTVPTFPNNATSISGSTECIDTTNHRMFVLSGKDSPDAGNMLQVIDVATVDNPTILGTVASFKADAGYRTNVTDDLNWVICVNASTPSSAAPNTIQVFNVSVPAAPTHPVDFDLTTFASPAINVTQAVIHGNLLYTDALKTGSETGYLAIYDITNPLVITQTSRTTIVDVPGDVVSVLLADVITVAGTIYAVLRVAVQTLATQEIQTWNVTNPAAPVFVAAVGVVPATPAIGRASRVADGILYLTGSLVANNAIHPFDLTNPAAPVALATSSVVAGTDNFTLRAHSNRVYLCSRNPAPNTFNKTFYIYNAANPAALALLGSVEYANNALGFGQPQQLHLDLA